MCFQITTVVICSLLLYDVTTNGLYTTLVFGLHVINNDFISIPLSVQAANNRTYTHTHTHTRSSGLRWIFVTNRLTKVPRTLGAVTKHGGYACYGNDRAAAVEWNIIINSCLFLTRPQHQYGKRTHCSASNARFLRMGREESRAGLYAHCFVIMNPKETRDGSFSMLLT